MAYIIAVVALLGVLFYSILKKKTQAPKTLVKTPEKWKQILLDKVNFYRNLNKLQRLQFETDIQYFLNEVAITGVQHQVSLEDRLLVASSAVIPLFGFPAWSYSHLDEVLLYPDSFDRDFNIGSQKEIITGMVGSGAMEGKMILSQPSLHLGFDITTDKKNVGIHEFVHLFDKESGAIDGVPPGYVDKSYALPWLDFVNQKTNEIIANRSDINDYGATNKQEFFAVASEYFFERPHLLKKQHPELYDRLADVFNQNMTEVIDQSSFKKQKDIGRNDPCPCGSGEKYKKCCLS